MLHQLRYGSDREVELELPPATVFVNAAQQFAPIDDVMAAVAAAVTDPLEYPQIGATTVPGDRIVLATEQPLSQAAAVIAGVINTLLEHAAAPEDILILVPPLDAQAEGADESAAGELSTEASRQLTSLLPPTVRDRVRVELHEPANESRLAYLAASKEGLPLYLNRSLVDADVVILLGTLRLQQSLGYAGVHSGLFPTFSDIRTRRRFRSLKSARDGPKRRRCAEAQEAGWLCGLQFTVQIVPGPGNNVLNVLAGKPEAVERRGRALCRAAWREQVPRRAELVVATIEGGPEQQTWDSVARALDAADQVAEDGAIVALCTELSVPPGPALKRLAGSQTDEAALNALRQDDSVDALAANQVAQLRSRCRLFLLSKLDLETVEDLGIGHIANARQLRHLCQGHDFAIVIENAQHARPHTPPPVSVAQED